MHCVCITCIMLTYHILWRSLGFLGKELTANLRTKILDFRGFDSSIILSIRGEILMPIGNFPEMLSPRILVGIILVGRLGAQDLPDSAASPLLLLVFGVAYPGPLLHVAQEFTLLDLCVSSLRRGHANILCIVPILTDDPRRESISRSPFVPPREVALAGWDPGGAGRAGVPTEVARADQPCCGWVVFIVKKLINNIKIKGNDKIKRTLQKK